MLDRAYETNFNKASNYQEPEETDFPAQPFQYEYGGADSYGRHFAKTESKDSEGVVKGEYRQGFMSLQTYLRVQGSGLL